LPKIATQDANVLFADDTSTIVNNSIDSHRTIVMNEIFMVKTNLLSLNFSKTHCLELRTRNLRSN